MSIHMEFTLLDGKVPILSTRKVPLRTPSSSCAGLPSGSTDIKFLKDRNCPVWDQWVLRGTGNLRIKKLTWVCVNSKSVV